MKKINSKLNSHIEWEGKSVNKITDWMSELHNDLDSFSMSNTRLLTLSMNLVSTYHGILGINEASHLKSNGWRDLTKSIQYKYWSLKFDYAFFEKQQFLNPIMKQKDLSTSYTDTANILAVMIALDKSAESWDAAEMLKNMLFNEGYVCKLHLDNSSFEPFMYWLSQKQLGNSLPNLENFKLGVYQEMIDNWDGDKFYPTLEKLVYYHIDNMDDNDKFGQDQFKKSPFDLMFFEIFAILKVANRSIPDFSFIDPFFAKLDNLKNIALQTDDTISRIEMLFYETF